jgi:peptidoglycan/LPS O-acetylase OafA/YrhL
MANSNRSDIAFISLLRATAALLVVWDHLVSFALRDFGMSWGPASFVDRYICGPLAIRERFGFFGVSLFFLISGFIITHVALREDSITFAVKRLFRIYPPVILSVIGVALIWQLPSVAPRSPILPYVATDDDVFWNCLLFNYVWPTIAVNIVTWSLLVEIVFYAITFLALPFLKRWPRAGVAVGLLASMLLNNRAVASYSNHLWYFGNFACLLPCLLLGQVIYFTWAGKFKGWDVAIFAGLLMEQFVRSHLYFCAHQLDPTRSRFVSFAYAIGVFVIAMLLNHRVRLNAIGRFVATISYSLYLWHYAVGFVVLLYLRHLPAGWALLGAFAASLGVAYLSWRLVERPSQQAARWLLNRFWAKKAPAAIETPPATG